jgi:hypothetical protein
MKKLLLILLLTLSYSQSFAEMQNDSTLDSLTMNQLTDDAQPSVEIVWSPILTAQPEIAPSFSKSQPTADFQLPLSSTLDDELQFQDFCVQAAANPTPFETSLKEIL